MSRAITSRSLVLAAIRTLQILKTLQTLVFLTLTPSPAHAIDLMPAGDIVGRRPSLNLHIPLTPVHRHLDFSSRLQESPLPKVSDSSLFTAVR